ncbi:MAG: XkdF-like putative serine protease domain-containing protein, partial [Bacteroidota bacterium]
DKSIQLGLPELPDGTWFIGTKVDEDHVWNDVKEGKVKGYSIEGFFNEVGVAMSGVKNYEAELVLELDQILAGLIK